MDHQIASRKLIFTIVLLSIFLLSLSGIATVISTNVHITICSDGSQATTLIRLLNKQYILMPSSSLKETLDCMGEAMSYYERTIDFVIASENNTVVKALKARYQIKNVQPAFNLKVKNIAIKQEKQHLVIQGNKTYLLYNKQITNPFTFVDEVRQNNPKVVIMPQMESHIRSVLSQWSDFMLFDVVELPKGRKIRFAL